jgi:hypothetical protein
MVWCEYSSVLSPLAGRDASTSEFFFHFFSFLFFVGAPLSFFPCFSTPLPFALCFYLFFSESAAKLILNLVTVETSGKNPQVCSF